MILNGDSFIDNENYLPQLFNLMSPFKDIVTTLPTAITSLD